MKTLIIGATGFLGRELYRELLEAGNQPVAVTRNIQKAREIFGNGVQVLEWDGKSAPMLAEKFGKGDVLINLAGESIAGEGILGKRWTAGRKKRITDSRISTGRVIAEAIRIAREKPSLLVQASAIGIYGSPVNQPSDESHPAGSGFIASLARDWELAVAPAESLVSRAVYLRTGLVLGNDGGVLAKMMLPFRFYSGTVLGNGLQWMSWIHIVDHVKAIRFIIEKPNCKGPYNLVAPNPVNMNNFIKTLGKVTGKPAWLKLPGFMLRAAFGHMAEETILSSQNIIPARLLTEGYIFKFPSLEPALADLLTKK